MLDFFFFFQVDQMANAVVFDKSLIVDVNETPLLEHSCRRLTPLVEV